MIINPSFLFPELVEKDWHYFKINELKPYHLFTCLCQSKLKINWSNEGPVIPTKINEIELINFKFKNNKNDEECQIWKGECKLCDKVIWACNNFNWVSWMTDFQQTLCLLKEIPVNHTHVEGENIDVLVFHRNTVVRFNKNGQKIN